MFKHWTLLYLLIWIKTNNKKNLKRRSQSVDEKFKGIPKPTWVNSAIDVCNRKCVFCPKSDENVAPTHIKNGRYIIDKIHDQLMELKFSGTHFFMWLWRPLLHKDISKIVEKLSKVSRVEIITNGDVLTSKKLRLKLG